jgi:hypothetical protein
VDVPARELRPVTNEKNARCAICSRASGRHRADHRVAILMGVLPNLFLRPIEPSVERMLNQCQQGAPARSGGRGPGPDPTRAAMMSSLNAVVPMACVTAAGIAAMVAEAFRDPGERMPIGGSAGRSARRRRSRTRCSGTRNAPASAWCGRQLRPVRHRISDRVGVLSLAISADHRARAAAARRVLRADALRDSPA